MKYMNLKYFSLYWLFIYSSISGAVAYIYFADLFLACFFIPIGFLMERYTAIDREKAIKREQLRQFREFIDFVSGSMTSSDKAIEVCVDEAIENLRETNGDRSAVFKEVLCMQKNMHANYQTSFPKEVLALADRLKNHDIKQWALSVSACYGKNNQGIATIIKNTSILIQEKIHIQDEISASAKEAENETLFMLFAPSGMILMMRFNMQDYFSAMYAYPIGKTLLWLCIIVNFGMFFLMKNMTRKEI